MARLVSVAEMVAIEQAADAAGLSYTQMMENAGYSLAQAVVAHSQVGERNVLALAGKGNNGGDALVALAELAAAGWHLAVYVVGDRQDEYVERVKAAGVKVFRSEEDKDHTHLKALVQQYAVLMDGLLGTGIKLPLRGSVPAVLETVNQVIETMEVPPFVVAVDVPSGMDGDSGEVAPEAMCADLTVCMAAVKRGMLSLPAFGYLGNLVIGDIGPLGDLQVWSKIRRYAVDEDMVAAVLPERPLDGHKGTFGMALIVAGSQNYPGAAWLASRAAARSGAGLVMVAAIRPVQAMLAGHIPEAVWLPIDEEEGGVAPSGAAQLDAGLERATAILLGSGFGLGAGRRDFIDGLLKQKLPPMVIDADGLKLLAEIRDWSKRLPEESILTPHPGEMSILCGMDIKAIQADRVAVAERFAKQWGQVLVLKGAFTVVAAPDGRTAIIPFASSALATAGTGDVLAGLICGLHAQGLEAFESAYAGAYLHAQAGQRAAERRASEAGIIAPDLIDELPPLLR